MFEAGVTVIVFVVPAIAFVPTVAPVPHWYKSPVPPVAVKVTEELGQYESAPIIEVGAVAGAATETIRLTEPL